MDEVSPAIPVVSSTPSKKTKLFFILGGVLALLIIVGGGAYYFFGKTSTPKVYHVGVLNALDYFSPVVDGFKQKMTELGYVEGKNIVYDIEKGAAPVGNQALVKKFVDDKVDLILVFPTEASLEAKEGTKGTNIPIISTAVSTEGNTLVDSVGHPGGAITGVRFPIPEVAARRFAVLHELVPNAKTILVPFLKDYPTVAPSLAALRPLAVDADITLLEVPFTTPDEVVAYLAAHEKNPGIDAILTIPEPVSILPPFIDPIYAFADAHHIPIAGAEISDTDSGPVFSIIPSSLVMGQLAAPLADKIFKGTQAGTIPIVTPGLVFDINYRALQKLGLTASESLLSTADHILH